MSRTLHNDRIGYVMDARSRINQRLFHARDASQRKKQLSRSAVPLLCFFLLCAIQASWFIVRVGPLTMPDPDMHASATYALATGQSLNPVSEETDEHGNSVQVQKITGNAQYLNFEGRDGVLADAVILLSIHGDTGTTYQHAGEHRAAKEISIPTWEHPGRANQYFPLLYLPQAVGLRLAWAGHTKMYDAWQISRITNLLFFMVLWGMAIILLPRGKLMLALIGSLPLTVFLASSLMLDGTVIAISACFVSLLAKLIDGGKMITRGELCSILALGFFLVCAKVVYAPILLVLCMIPAASISRKHKFIITGAWLCLVLGIFFPWYANFSFSLANTNIAQNVQFLIQHPLHGLSMMLGTLIRLPARLPIFSVAQFSIVLLSWACVLIHESTLHKAREPGVISWVTRNRFILYVSFSILLSLMLTILFLGLTWNNLQGEQGLWLQGFQERYVSPLLPFLVLAFVGGADSSTTPDCRRYGQKIPCT
jgi:hypothetical protein